MRKIFFIASIFFLALATSTAFAARERIGVLIIGGAEFMTDDYIRIVTDNLKPKSRSKIFSGNDVQGRYKKVWINFGGVGTEEKPAREDLLRFTAVSGYEKVVYFVVSDSTVDKHNNAGSREKDRVTVQVDAYVCSPSEVEEVFTAAHDENSKTSSLRARRGAFRKCVVEITKSLNKIL